MAAYAALVSLLNTIDHIQDHPSLSITLQQNQIQVIQQSLHFLLDFIECGPLHIGVEEEAETLERQIASAAYAAEDVIETHAFDHIQAAAGCVSLLDLQTVIQDMNYVKEKVATFKHQIKYLKPTYYPVSVSTPSGKSTMVGFDDKLYQLLDALTGHQSALQIIPIVGMGGIGKTTLARNVYEHSLILQRFDIRAWATISLEYSVKDIFSDLLSRESKSNLETEYQQLAQELYQSLIGRRYLVVLDDMWSIEVWDKIKFFFPDNNNGSRVVVTTRLSNMATHFDTLLQMQLLDEDSSWKLFCEKVFPNEGCCPSELVEIGMKIAKKCKGLPLLIVVIGSLLRKSSRTREYWEDMSNDINSILNTREEEEIKNLDILRLSYRHLPTHLKPCFLYMGIFPEDDVIHTSRLIKLWVAEGFVKPYKTQSLEDVAWGYLKDLIDRSLLISCRLKTNGKTKICQMHDLLRDLCLKIVEKERFLSEIMVFQQETATGFDGSEATLSLAHSLLSKRYSRSIKFKLFRALNMNDISKQANLRYIESVYDGNSHNLLSSIPLLWNLQTLIVDTGESPFFAPPEIWEMQQLRHVEFYRLWLPDPPLSNQEFVRLNLQILKVWNLMLTEEVWKRVPHLKKLTIVYQNFSRNLSFDFRRLQELESLNCVFLDEPNVDDLLQSLTFPSSLRKLSLNGCGLRWEDLSMIGSLPHLQVLKLGHSSVTGGSEWSLVEGEFLSLKFLNISYCSNLINWNIISDDYCSGTFPVLEKLYLSGLGNLNEIPSCIGEIPTLGFIYVMCCSESAAISAMKILEEQESLGNDCLQVEIEFQEEEELRSFKEKVQHMDCFASTNLHLRSWGINR